MKKIGIYLDFPPEGGGAFQYAQSVLEALSVLPSSKYQVVVAYSHSAWKDKLNTYSSVNLIGLPIPQAISSDFIKSIIRFGFPLPLWRFIAKHFHSLTQQLCNENCNLWIFPGQEVWTYALPVPALGVIHDLMHRYERQFPEVSSNGLYYRRELHYKRLCAKSKGILVDSNVGKEQVMESYDTLSEHLHILPFVAPPYIHHKTEGKDFEKRYQLPIDFFFYPAQFWEHKNHARLIRAYAKIRTSAPNVDLVLVGSKKNGYLNVLHLIEELELKEHVHVLGYVPDEDMVGLYRRARALVMPTFFGPTNIPPLEAMTVGCPMAVSNIYAMPEQVGDAALLFDPLSIDEIAEALLKLATDNHLCKQLSKKAHSRAELWKQSHFNGQLQSILASILED